MFVHLKACPLEASRGEILEELHTRLHQTGDQGDTLAKSSIIHLLGLYLMSEVLRSQIK